MNITVLCVSVCAIKYLPYHRSDVPLSPTSTVRCWSVRCRGRGICSIDSLLSTCSHHAHTIYSWFNLRTNVWCRKIKGITGIPLPYKVYTITEEWCMENWYYWISGTIIRSLLCRQSYMRLSAEEGVDWVMDLITGSYHKYKLLKEGSTPHSLPLLIISGACPLHKRNCNTTHHASPPPSDQVTSAYTLRRVWALTVYEWSSVVNYGFILSTNSQCTVH